MKHVVAGIYSLAMRLASFFSVTGDTRPRPLPQPRYPSGMVRQTANHPSIRR